MLGDAAGDISAAAQSSLGLASGTRRQGCGGHGRAAHICAAGLPTSVPTSVASRGGGKRFAVSSRVPPAAGGPRTERHGAKQVLGNKEDA